MIRGFDPFRFLSSASRLIRGLVFTLSVVVLSASFLVCAADEDGVDYSPRRTHRQSRHRVSVGTTHSNSASQAAATKSSAFAGGLPAVAVNLRFPLVCQDLLLQLKTLAAHKPDLAADSALPRPPPSLA
jgi:hypothetical protein